MKLLCRVLMILTLSGVFILGLSVSAQKTGSTPTKSAPKKKKAETQPGANSPDKPINVQTEIKLLKARLAIFDRLAAQGKSTLSPQAAGSCSNSATPCCCQIASPPAACMTKADCDNIAGRCVKSGIGCD